MTGRTSYREILRSSSIIGGSSAINVLTGLARTKIAAVLLGPSGVGMIGLLQSLLSTAATVSAFGLGTVGTQQIAEAAGRRDGSAIAVARRALSWGTFALAVAGMGGFFLLRNLLASRVVRDPSAGAQVGILAIGVGLSVAAGSQTALLVGLRRVGDVARLSVATGVLSAVLGVGALLGMKEWAVAAYVLATPIASFLLGYWYVSRLGYAQRGDIPLSRVLQQWRTMLPLGAAFMSSGVVVTVGQLTVRSLVKHELGAEALGQFQAAWAISMTYTGLVLTAMGTDYYPRLAATISDPETTNRLVNEQTEVALLLSAPIILAMTGLAPWVVRVLYSNAFGDAARVLRWQIQGDLLKVASWPLGYIILAAGDGRTFMGSESIATAVLVGVVWVGLPAMGIQATGVAVLLMYAVYLPLTYWLAWRRTGFGWEPRIAKLFAVLLGSSVVVYAVSEASEVAGGLLGCVCAFGLGTYGLACLGAKAKIEGRLGRAARAAHGVMRRLGLIHEPP